MLTAHQRIAWARRWPGYTLKFHEEPESFFEVEGPGCGEAGGVRIIKSWLPFCYGPGGNLAAAKEIVDLLNSA